MSKKIRFGDLKVGQKYRDGNAISERIKDTPSKNVKSGALRGREVATGILSNMIEDDEWVELVD